MGKIFEMLNALQTNGTALFWCSLALAMLFVFVFIFAQKLSNKKKRKGYLSREEICKSLRR